MANIKISAAADAGTLLSSDMIPLARSGNTNAYHATMTEVAAFTNASIASGAYGNVGRNVLHNPLFSVAQRGAGPFTSNGYTLDRWFAGGPGGDTFSYTAAALADADRAAIGDEAAITALQNVFTGNAGAGAGSNIQQRIEGVRRLAGKTVTVSLWAKAASGTPKLGINVYQSFGTGGSPSTGGWVLATGTAVTLATTWARYTATVAITSASGKTLGTNGDDYTMLGFWYSSGATNNATAGNIGVQSGTISLWGVQLEIGSVATPLEKPDPRYDLANCQRFYTTNAFYLAGNTAGGAVVGTSSPLSPPMRATPTVATSGGGSFNNVGGPSYSLGSNWIGFTCTTGSAGNWNMTFAFTASADL